MTFRAGVDASDVDALGRDLDDFADDLQDALDEASRQVVEKVAVEAAANARSRPGVAPKVAPSFDTVAGPPAAVGFGGDAYPFAGGAEFGSDIFRQFDSRVAPEGYFFAPAVEAVEDGEGEYLQALDGLTQRNRL